MAHYTYEGVHYELPDGLSNEDAIKKIETHLGKAPKAKPKKERTTFMEDVRQGFASLGNTADTLGTLAIGGLGTLAGQNHDGKLDSLFEGLTSRKKSRNEWAGGQGKEKGLSGALTSAVVGLPGMMMAPVSGLERATDLLDKGVPLSQAGPAGAIDSALSIGAAAIPIFGKTLLRKAVSGAAANVATGGASDVATQAIVQDDKVSKEYNPLDFERRLTEAIIGGAAGPMTGKTKPKETKPRSASDKLNKLADRIEPKIAETSAVEAPKSDFVDMQGRPVDIPQNIRDQQAINNRNTEPVNPLRRNGEPNAVDHSAQQALPFEAGPEEMVRQRYQEDFTNPTDEPMQRDMFAEQDMLAQDKDPYADKQNRLFEEDAAYKQREQQQLAETQAENARRAEADKVAEQQRAQELRDEIYRTLEENLSKERVSKGQKRKAMGRQRGVIDYETVKEAISFLGKGLYKPEDVLKSYGGAFHPDEMQKAMEAIDNPNSKDKMVLMTPDQFHELALPRSHASSLDIAGMEEKQFSIRIGLQGKNGLRDIPYLRLENKNGKTVVDAHEGRHRMDVFKQEGVELVPVRIRVGEGAKWGEVLPEKQRYNLPVTPQTLPEPIIRQGIKVPAGQRGALVFGKAKDIATMDESSPEIVAAKTALERSKTAKAVLGTDEGFRADMDTPEAVLAAVLENPTKDIPRSAVIRGTTVTNGAGRIAGQTNHPLVKFVRDSVRNALRDSEQVMRQFVTKKDGLGTMWNKLSQAEKNEVFGAWKLGDERQTRITPEMMDGFTDTQKAALEHIYKMQDFLFERTKQAYEHAGLDPIHQRDGHMPGVFKGDYRAIVMTRNGVDKAGKPIWKPVQFFSADTKPQFASIKGKVEEMFQGPGFKIEHIELQQGKRTPGLTGEIGVLMELLGKNDEAFAKVQQQLKDISAETASKLYGAHLHAKEKMGIGGNEGNKFWKSVDENTNEGMKAYLQYYEDMIASHNLLKTEVDLSGLMNNAALDGMPNAKEYAREYLRHTQGRSIGDVGRGIDALLEAGPKLLGIGPSYTRAAIHQVAKRLGQKAMGFFNIPFTAMQFLQLGQTALPEMIGLAKNSELGGAGFAKSLSEASVDMLALTKERLSGEKSTEPTRRAMFDFAEANGLLNFSEFADVNKVTQSKAGRIADTVIDANRVLGEAGTRPVVFFAFVRMLEKSGLPKAEILDTAYNKTQYAMIDYTPPEQPMMYGKLGMAGKMAGTLKTFQHGFMGQQLDWIGRAAKGDWTPLATGLTMGLLFAGGAGMAGYQEMDAIYQFITDKMGKRQTIRETILANVPDLVKNGVLSDMTNINLQSRLGQANLLPDTFLDSISPYAGSIGDMASSAYELAKDPNAITATAAAKTWAPSSLRGPIENAFGKGSFVKRADGQQVMGLDGKPLQYTKDKEGQNDYPREERDWKLRYFGLTSMTESLDKERLYNNTLSNMSDKDARAKLMTYMLRGFRTQEKFGVTKDFAALREKYIARGGDPDQLVQQLQDKIKGGQLSRKQRLEGIPNGSIGSIHNYESFNK